MCAERSFGTANSVFFVRNSMLDLSACAAARGACTVHAMPVDWESLLHGTSVVVACASRQDVICFRFLDSKTSRGGALKASGLALKRDAERKVNKFHAQMTFIRLLSFIRDVRFLVATSDIYS